MLAGIPAGHYTVEAKCAVRPAVRRIFADGARINARAVVGIAVRQHDSELNRRSIVQLLRETESQFLLSVKLVDGSSPCCYQLLDFVGDSGGGNIREEEPTVAPDTPYADRCAR